MLTLGVDLAAEPNNTAVAQLSWSVRGAVVQDLALNVDDGRLLSAVRGVDKAGVDCPLGWPRAFVAFLVEHQAGDIAELPGPADKAWRHSLAYRATDDVVRALGGPKPLSVAADKIAHPAMRTAALLADLGRTGVPVDRAGTGVVVEVYPALSLYSWGLPYAGYKDTKNRHVLDQLVDQLLARAPWLDLTGWELLCRSSDHAFDAVIAALTARAAAVGATSVPSADLVEDAAVEGWIAVSIGSLRALAP